MLRLLCLGSLHSGVVLLIVLCVRSITTIGSIRVFGAGLLRTCGSALLLGVVLRVVVGCRVGGSQGRCDGRSWLCGCIGRVVAVRSIAASTAAALAVRAIAATVIVPVPTEAISSSVTIPSAISIAATAAIVSIASAIAAAIVSVSAAVAAVAGAWRARLELFVLLRDVGHEVLAQLLGLLHHVRVWASDVQVHGLFGLAACGVLDVTRSLTLDLHTAACLLLDVLDVGAAMADNLGAQVEAWDGLKGDGDLLFGPFALEHVSNMSYDKMVSSRGFLPGTYSTEFVSLNGVLLATLEPAFVHQLWEVLLHELLDLLDGLLKTLLCLACDMQVEWRVLDIFSSAKILFTIVQPGALTYGSSSHGLVGIVVASSGDILVKEQKRQFSVLLNKSGKCSGERWLHTSAGFIFDLEASRGGQQRPNRRFSSARKLLQASSVSQT